MLKTFASAVLISAFLFSISAAENGFPQCNCNDEGFWTAERIWECQRVSDFLIAVAYFSIPMELLYFISCSTLPFKWVLFEFTAFIVLCGMTHLLNGWTYGPHPFQLMLILTVFKTLTAIVSLATAVTLFSILPLVLKFKIREFMLRKKTRDLGLEVGIIKKKTEAGLHVRMLTREIRKSLDRHTILYTTLVELSKTLDLQNCAVWMPNANKTEMNLIHELKKRNALKLPITDPDVRDIKASDGVKILGPDSALAVASSGGGVVDPASVVAIRMPMLKCSNFKGGTPEMVHACYAVLVLVPPGGEHRTWSYQELEIVKVVADQVAVAVSHAAVLEESQSMREKLEEQNRALQLAKQDALMASQARNAFLKVMSDGMRRPMHTVTGLLSLMKDENLNSEQKILVDAMVKTSNVLSTLINDVMDASTKENGRFTCEMRSFQLHSMIKEASCLVQCLCVYRGYDFAIEVDKSLPNHLMGDERRVCQVILHMVGSLLNGRSGGGRVTFRVYLDGGDWGRNDQRWATWRSSSSDDYAYVKFQMGINNYGSQSEGSRLRVHFGGRRYNSGGTDEDLSFTVCKKLVQLMQGNIWINPNSDGFDQSMGLILRFQLRSNVPIGVAELKSSSDHPHPNSLFHGLQVLIADHDDGNRVVTRKLLQKLGCKVSDVKSGYECVSAIGSAASSFQIVLLDLHMLDLDGFDIAMRIRKFRSRNCPLIIALVTNADEDLWDGCLQVGIKGIIQKPVLLQGIADEIRRVLMLANRAVRG